MENSIEDFLNGFQEDSLEYRIIREVRNGATPSITNLTDMTNPDGEVRYSVEIDGMEPLLCTEEVANTILAEVKLKENSDTLLVNNATSRFSGAMWYEAIQKEKVILAGLGGIGSYVGFLLGRLRVNTTMYDNDIVEEANMSGQLYGCNDIGRAKTSSLFNFIANYSSFFNLSTLTKRYDNSCRTEKVMICGFDNMASRKLFFNKWLTEVANGSPENCLFIDGRLAAEEFQIFAIQGNDKRAIEEYQAKWLFSDDEAENTLCSYKQTSFMANMIASMMINIFVNFVANKCNPLIPREVPFFTYYSDDNMFLKVES